jgi:uncharacterized protein
MVRWIVAAVGGVPALLVLIAVGAWMMPRPRPAAVQLAATAKAVLPPITQDSFGDGMPDAMRLEDPIDRERFRRWFSYLAEMQFYYPNADSAREVNDCAALIRYAYHEALRRHDSEWRRRFASPVEFAVEDVARYRYPRTPLGTNLFRLRAGPLGEPDLATGGFGEFADAETLVHYNTHPAGRSAEAARKGDLLVYFQPGQKQPFHTMIYLGASELLPTPENDWVVYHTGGDTGKPGVIKKVPLSVLRAWRPIPQNESFRGFYRWNILR